MKYMTIEDRLSSIESQLETLIHLVSSMESTDLARTKLVGPTEIAQMLGVSRTTLYASQRYRLPNFGVKRPDADMKWTLGEVIDWNKQPEEELKRRYKELGLKDQGESNKQ